MVWEGGIGVSVRASEKTAFMSWVKGVGVSIGGGSIEGLPGEIKHTLGLHNETKCTYLATSSKKALIHNQVL